jgi:penicillin-binding protein 1C
VRKHRNVILRLALGFFLAVALALVAFHVVRPFPLRQVQSREQCRVFLDRDGDMIRVELGGDEQWRLPVPLSRVSRHLINATLAAEDKRFFDHGGIDWIAVVRAALGNLHHGRIVSGASTISMQLGRLSAPDEPWGWTRKLRQATRALHLEFVRDKDWILQQYLNLAPYGGNLVGCEAAARFYVGKPVAELTLSEASLLAGIPQHPVKLRPDRHPAAARRRQRHVLERMLEDGMITGDEFQAVLDADAVGRVREHRGQASKNAQALGLPLDEPLFCRLAAGECPLPMVQTTLDRSVQDLLRTALIERVAELSGVADAAGVIIENRTGAIRALVGTVDFCEPRSGQVNAATSVRSPGSALKPFIYLMAIEQGLILPGTKLLDEPLGYEDYRPGNFDDEFRGEVTATRALSESLNTPAVRLLEKVGIENALERLKECGLRSLPDAEADCGLALALGGVGVRLLDLTNAYAVLARDGKWMPARFTVTLEPAVPGGKTRRVSTAEDCRLQGEEFGQVPWCPQSSTVKHGVWVRQKRTTGSRENAPMFNPDAVVLLREMLNALPLPGCDRSGVCWKTGTSSGFRDAWCFAFDSRFTVGIWLGNKSGTPSRSLVGIEAAAPVAARVMNALAGPGICAWTEADEGQGALALISVCRASGLRAGPYCHETESVPGLRNVPLRHCSVCGVRDLADDQMERGLGAGTVENCEVRKSMLLIQSPEPGVYLTLDDSGVEISCVSVGGDNECEWFVDGEFAGRGPGLSQIRFTPGMHTVTCTMPESGASARVQFSVRLGK